MKNVLYICKLEYHKSVLLKLNCKEKKIFSNYFINTELINLLKSGLIVIYILKNTKFPLFKNTILKIKLFFWILKFRTSNPKYLQFLTIIYFVDFYHM